MDKKLLLSFFKGLISFIPGFKFLLQIKRKKNRNSCSFAKFCYSFWLRIIVYNYETNENFSLDYIGEIGTAGSLGLGMCALLSGSKKYYALDIENFYNLNNNLRLFDEIVSLFQNNVPIPEDFDNINLRINNYFFPKKQITHLYKDEKYVLELRNDLILCLTKKQSKYFIVKQNWHNSKGLNLDFIFSRAVMEHVKNPSEVYLNIKMHLNPTGHMLHDIELHSHNLTNSIDGHLYLNKYIWAIVFGTRKFLLNRWSLEKHIESITHNYTIISIIKNYKEISINNSSQLKLFGASIFAKI